MKLLKAIDTINKVCSKGVDVTNQVKNAIDANKKLKGTLEKQTKKIKNKYFVK